MAGNKKADKKTLNGIVDKINRELPSDGKDVDKHVDRLLEAFEDDIVTGNTSNVIVALASLKETKLQNDRDTNVNDAVRNIEAEIRVIQAAIDAEEAAAKVLADAKKKK